MILSHWISERTLRLLLFTFFALLLLAGRLALDQPELGNARPVAVFFRPPAMLFLGWNLFLAWVPYGLSLFLQKQSRAGPLAVMLLLVWMLFFPNAPYLLTDLIHLRARPPVPLWYDLVLILTFAWVGLLLGFASLEVVKEWLAGYLPPGWRRLVVPCSLALAGFGLYLGRVLRWNSWDLFANPGSLLASVLELFLHPAAHWEAWGMSGVFFVLLMLMYYGRGNKHG